MYMNLSKFILFFPFKMSLIGIIILIVSLLIIGLAIYTYVKKPRWATAGVRGFLLGFGIFIFLIAFVRLLASRRG